MTTPRECRDRRYAARVEINGRMVAVNARVHGTASTRKNHGCECAPCTAAARADNTPRRRELRRSDPDFRRRANEASRRWREKRRQAGGSA